MKVQAHNATTGVLISTVLTDSTGKWDFGDLSVIPTIYAYTEFGIRLVFRGEIVGSIVGSVDLFTSGALRVNATSVLGGDGAYIDYNAGTPRFRVGTISMGALAKGIYWDGANLAWIGINTSLTAAGLFTATNAVITGTITATLGAIGGWVIGATSLMDAAGGVGMSSAVTAGDDIRFWAGHTTPGSAPFRVTEAGSLVATSATITGAITALSGTIGSFTIGTYLYTGSKAAYNDANAGVHVGGDGIGIGNNVFTVSSAGALVATSATITGAITATSGSVGGWTIAIYKLSSGTGASGVGIHIDGYGMPAFYAGSAAGTDAPFRVSHTGALVATSATITGAIVATSGSISSFTIGTYLYTGSKAAWNDANAGVHLGSDGIGIGNNVFTVNGSTGALVATSATITGAITATSGSIGSFTIGTYLYTGSKTAWNDANAGVHVGSDGIGIGNNIFTVNGSTGALVATSATITGTITANAGVIAGFTVDSTEGLYAGTGATRVQMKPGAGFWSGATLQADATWSVTQAGYMVATSALIANWSINQTVIQAGAGATNVGMHSGGVYSEAFWAGGGPGNPGTALFRVTFAGALFASNATITGAITATSGTIGSFTIGTYLYTGSKTAWNDANAGVHLGSDGIGIGNNVFTVNGSTGAMVATSATITGSITAAAGNATLDGYGLWLNSGATALLGFGGTSAAPKGTIRMDATYGFVINYGLYVDFTQTVGLGHITVRRGTATRYRSAWYMGEADNIAYMNAYDDTGGVYLNFRIDAFYTILGMQGAVGIGISDVMPAQLSVKGLTAGADLLDATTATVDGAVSFLRVSSALPISGSHYFRAGPPNASFSALANTLYTDLAVHQFGVRNQPASHAVALLGLNEDNAAGLTQFYGVVGAAINNNTTNAKTLVCGTQGEGVHQGTGNAPGLSVIGTAGVAINQSAYNVGYAMSLFASTVQNNGGGTITHAFGLYLQPQIVGTNKWDIYHEGTAPNIGFGNGGTMTWKDAASNTLMSLADAGTTGVLTVTGGAKFGGSRVELTSSGGKGLIQGLGDGHIRLELHPSAAYHKFSIYNQLTAADVIVMEESGDLSVTGYIQAVGAKFGGSRVELTSSGGKGLIQGIGDGHIRLELHPSAAYHKFSIYNQLTAADVAIFDEVGNFGLIGYIEGVENSGGAPAAPPANGFKIFAQDNGAGKTQLMVIFATGAAQVLATQP